MLASRCVWPQALPATRPTSRQLASEVPAAPCRGPRPAVRALSVRVAAASSSDDARATTRTRAAAAVAAPSSNASSVTSWAPPPSPRGAGSSSSSTSPWLGAAVKEAVRGIDDAPFLLLTDGQQRAFLRHRLSPSVVSCPALFPGIAAVVSEAAGWTDPPSSIMLVHPLAEGRLRREPGGGGGEEGGARRGDLPRPLAGVADLPPAAAAWAGSGSSHHHLRLADTSRLVDAGLAVAEVAGRVGDACCDEAEGSESDTDTAASALPAALNAHAASLAYDHPAHEPAGSEPGVAYYGVVVLSGEQAAAAAGKAAPTRGSGGGGGGGGDAGCYVLKTVRAPAVGGCSCVYFTLTRVYKGEPLAAQLVTSWLA